MNEGFLKGDDERVKYYTGLPNFDLFHVFLLNVLPFLRQGKKKLTPFQYILLTLMRLRLDLPIQHLGHLFRVHRTTVGVAFQETVTVLHTLFSPDKDSLLASMPRSFVETLKAKCQKALSDGETVTGKNSAASKDSATVKDGVAINCSGIGKNSVDAKDSVTANDSGSTIDSVT